MSDDPKIDVEEFSDTQVKVTVRRGAESHSFTVYKKPLVRAPGKEAT